MYYPLSLTSSLIQMKIITTDAFSFAAKPKIIALLFWIIIFIALLGYAIFKQYILPKYFFFDENTITQFMQWGAQFKPGDSYASTAKFFSILGVDRATLWFPPFAAVLIIAQYLYHLKKSKARHFTLIELVIFVFLAFLSVTYMSMLSKDFIVALVITPFIFFAKRGLPGILTWSMIALLYATYFRTYWFIMIPIFWGLYTVFRVTRKRLYLILSVPLTLLALSFTFSLFLGLDLDNFRTTINDSRIEGGDNNARTMILPWIDGGGPVLSWLNSTITWVTLMIPMPLFILLSPYYLFIASLITVLFYKLWIAFFQILAHKSQPDLAACSALIISFIAIQAIFEPDYGSYVRHLAPLYPLCLYVIFKSRTLTHTKKTAA